MKSPRAAFTLIELLAVVSMVLVLLALVLPVTSKMQYSARSAACLANLHKIGSAFALYTSDNDGLFPALRYRDESGENPTKENWQFEINPYLEANGSSFKNLAKNTSGRPVFCPEYYREYKTSPDAQKLTSGGYGMNPSLGTSVNSWDKRTPSAAIPRPVQTVLVGDSDDYHLNVKADTWQAADKDTGRYTSGDPLRHIKTANYLFVDGHATPLTPDQAEEALIP